MKHPETALLQIDALGLLCPLPVLRLRKVLQNVPSGGLVQLCADDPMARIDVPHFCAGAGHALVSVEETDAGQAYIVRAG